MSTTAKTSRLAARATPLKTTWAARLLPLLLVLALPAAVQAQYNFTTNNGAITITGYTGPSGAVIIPGTINGLPVTSIGIQAFYENASLTSVTIPGNVASIGPFAFLFCTGLTNATIANGVTSIGDYAFQGCNLTGVTIPASVTNVGYAPFAVCVSLAAITVDPQNALYSSLSGALFDKSQTTLVEYPAGLGGSYTFPGSLNSIRDYAFFGCSSLTSFTIPDSVTSIGEWAFEYCTGLTTATIPASVTNIGYAPFADCSSLSAITVDAHNPFLQQSEWSVVRQERNHARRISGWHRRKLHDPRRRQQHPRGRVRGLQQPDQRHDS